jgi:uncharacterized membrane protein
VYGISASAQVVVGVHGSPGAVWQPGGTCREDLPLLVAGGAAQAFAVNADGTMVGGDASGVPVRWKKVAEQWSIEQLDTRSGQVFGANATGDLAGYVEIPCGTDAVCQHAFIWYVTGGSLELGTLGGADSWARDINASGEVVGNASGEVVGVSTSRRGLNTAFFWSPDPGVGMVQLPFTGRSAAANAISDVRPDGTRLAVGRNSRGAAVVWVIRNP